MATALKLKSDIKKLKAAINSKATPKSFLPKLKNQLERAEGELKSLKEAPKGGKPKKSTSAGTEKTLTALEKLVNKKKYSVYKGRGVDLKKDAGEGAFQTGRRVSKGLKSNQYGSAKENKGNVYYEYRPNRLDVKQPKKKQTYPKLEDGGMMARGGKAKIELKDASNLSEQERFELKVLKALRGYNKGLNINSLLEELRFSNYRYNIRATDEELKQVESALSSLINKGYVEESGFGYNQTVEGRRYLDSFQYGTYADGGMMAKGGEINVKGKSIKLKYVKKCCPSIKHDGSIGNYQYDFVDEMGNPFIGYGNSKEEALKSIEEYQNSFASGGYMAKGGEVRYKLKGSNFGQQIENGQKFKALISKVHANQTGENKYPENFIKEIAYTGKIVKSDGSNYLKDYAYKGTLTKFEFLDDKDFIEALKYVDRPAIRKFEEGGMFEKPIAAVMDNHGNIKSQKKLERDLEYLRQGYEDKMITKYEYDKEKNEIEQQIQSLRNKEEGDYMASGGELHRSEEKYAEGGTIYSEDTLKEIIDEEILTPLYNVINGFDILSNYLRKTNRQVHLTKTLSLLNYLQILEASEKIEEYTSKK